MVECNGFYILEYINIYERYIGNNPVALMSTKNVEQNYDKITVFEAQVHGALY